MSASKPESTHALLSPVRSVAQRIHAFSNMISGHFYRRTEQPLGITLPEWRVLRSVLLQPGVSQSEIAATEGLNVMNVSRAVAGLRAKALVEVEPDPRDRRRTLVTATPHGTQLGEDIGAREGSIYEHVFSVLSPDEVDVLDGLLERVNSGLLDRELPEPPPPSRDWLSVLSDE